MPNSTANRNWFQAASVFVLYATSSANAAAQKCSRKTITGGDVITAMGDMEFEKVKGALLFVALHSTQIMNSWF